MVGMVTIFNRRELCITQNLEQYSKFADALAASGIEYYAKAFGHSSQFGERSRRGSFGQSSKLDNFYKVYVKRSDYELATRCINQVRG